MIQQGKGLAVVVCRCHSGSKGLYFERTFKCSVPVLMEKHTDDEIEEAVNDSNNSMGICITYL